MVEHELILNVGDSLTVTVADPKDRSTTAPGSNNNNYNEFKIAGGGRRKTRKAGKKVGGAKRALSGFMRFSQKMRPEVMRENPGIAFGDVGRRLGEKWRSLGDAEKARY